MDFDSVQEFVEAFSKLPGVGPRQATRLAFYLVNSGTHRIKHLSSALSRLEQIKLCSRCFFVHQNNETLCNICKDPNRNNGTLAITERVTDIIALEKARLFEGRYFVIGDFQKSGLLSPIHRARLALLKQQVETEGKFKEIILAMSPTSHGNINASLLSEELRPYTEKITRLGRGMPTGGEIEFADDETLKESLRHRG